MKRQPQLFEDDPYVFYGEFPDDYPKGTFRPLHPKFTRRANVFSAGKNPRKYTVDLSINECDCQKGWGFAWDDKRSRYYSQAYCTHKMKIMASITADVLTHANKAEAQDIQQAYLKALGTRYNPFEVVSAFHKELRRGDFEAAWFWGLMLATKRSLRGVLQYMLNIIYEETRDHDLAIFLMQSLGDPRKITLASTATAIAWFCQTKKKWELAHRMPIFDAEMNGYRLLAKDYSPEVAKGSNIIPGDQKAKLLKLMTIGAGEHDLVKFQRGLKGLQKLQFADTYSDDALGEHRYWLYEQLYDLADALLPEEHSVWRVIDVVNRRINAGRGIGYHELNAIGDAITGEPYAPGVLPPATQAMLKARPVPTAPLGKWPQIPLYAHDNHTYGGKALMRRHGEQLKPGAKQTDLDFRWCGAYFGVAFRMISFDQYRKVEEWHKVMWPTSLYKIVDMLWY